MSAPADVADSLTAEEVVALLGPSNADDVARRSRDAYAAWEEPVPLGGETVPMFPVDALPPELGDYVRALADFSEVPHDLPGVLTLAVAAAAVARKIMIEVRPEYVEPLNIYACVAMPPGTRKTWNFAAVSAPLVDYEREMMATMGPQIAEAQSHARVRAKELAEAETRAAKASGAERTKWDAERRGLAAEVRDLVVPAEPRVIMSEATPEALANGIAEQGGRLAVFSPEGDVFSMLKRYSKDGVANIETLLKAHAGDELRIDRRHLPPVTVSHPALTIGLAVQPDVLHGLARDRIFRERGLLARFLFSVPVTELGRRTFDGPAVPQAVREGYCSAILWLCRHPPIEVPLTLAPEAFETWRDFALEVECDRGPGGRFSGLLDWSGKLPGLVARLAGILHCVEGAAGGRISPQVPQPRMAEAVTLGRYAAQHALAAFGMMGADASDTDAKTVLQWLERTRPQTFTTRDLCRADRGLGAERARAALRELHERGWIRPELDKQRPGRPSETWAVHPGLTNG